jgi:hypothetical protein
MLNKKKVFKNATLARCWRVFSPHSHLLDANISNGMLTVNRRFLVRHVGFLCTMSPLSISICYFLLVLQLYTRNTDHVVHWARNWLSVFIVSIQSPFRRRISKSETKSMAQRIFFWKGGREGGVSKTYSYWNYIFASPSTKD